MILGIYRRVSTEDQAINGLSLDNQELRGKELATKLGFEYKVYTDAGISGTVSFDKRKGLNNLINDVIEKKIQAVFITDLDRLSRGGVIQTTLIKNIFKDNNVRLFDLNQEIDLNDINQELLTDIRSLLASFETKKTSVRIKQNLEKSILEGRASGGPLLPYGYKKDDKKQLVIDKAESEVVKRIFKLALEGKGTKVISGILNNEGIPTKRGRVKEGASMIVKGQKKTNFVWRDSVIYNMLTNPIYKGERLYKGKTYASPMIIEKATFNLVQDELLKRNYFKNTTNKYQYLLKGLIICPICKNRFFGHKRANGRDNAYVCGSKRYTGGSCGNVGINIDFLNGLIIDNIMDFDKIVNATFKVVRGDDFFKNIKDSIRINNQIIEETEKAIDNLLDITEKAGISPKTFKSRFNKLNNRINFYKNENNLLIKKENILKEEDGIKKVVKLGIKMFKNYTFEEQQNFIRSLISNIYVRWIPTSLCHMITIDFRIDILQNYLVSKELLMNRTHGGIKRVTKIIDEKILIKKIYEDGTDDVYQIKYVK